MKKRFYALLLALVLCLGLVPAAGAAGATTVVLKIGSNRMAVGTAVQAVDAGNAAVCPILQNSRTLVPVSRIVDAFGGKSAWNGSTRTATISLNGKTVTHVVGTSAVTTPGGVQTMEVPSRIIQERTYVPVRYVLEGLGLHVAYEPKNQLVVVSSAPLSGDLLALPGAKALLDDLTRTAAPASKYTAGTLIAPARSKASMEPTHSDGAYVQDLGAATGFVLYPDSGDSYSNIYRYTCDYALSDEELLDEVGAYVDLLAARPDLELVRPFGSDDTGLFHFAYLNYTGSKARMKGNLDAWLWDGRTAHVEVYVSLYSSQEVMVSLDENLKYADLGLRTSGADLSPYQVSGARVGDAYYLNQGVYYNSADQALVTTSGKAALLIGGKFCTAAAEFQTGYKDHITLSGFSGSDTIDLSFPIDGAAAGDVYGLDDLRYGSGESTDGPYLCVNYDNYRGWATPRAHPDREVYEATVRVLRWDKSGAGDTVLYFHALADIGGVTREYEGLVAVPWGDAPSSGSGSGSGGGPSTPTRPGGVSCSVCGGDGKRECGSCSGRGYFERRESTPDYSGSGPKYYTVKVPCGACQGTGEKACTFCGGDGKVGT